MAKTKESVNYSQRLSNNQWRKAALYTKAVSAFKDTLSVSDDEDLDTKKQIKYGNSFQAAWGLFSEYCENSTIHGIKYLGEQRRPCLERLFWIMVFGVSIYTCASLTKNIWDKWHDNPVIVSFAEKSTPVWQIPFPTVTVCPETKSRQTIFNFTNVFWKIADKENLTAEEELHMEAISQVCESHLMAESGFGQKFADGSALIDSLSTTTPIFNKTYLSCKWRNILGFCKKMFRKIVTEDGICYSFNSLSPSEIYREEGILSANGFEIENRTSTNWNVEDGYSDDAGPETFPNRVLGAGTRAGLYMVLNGFEKDFDDLCRGPVQGFKVLLHTPGEVAQVSKQYFRIPFDQEVLISIKPKIITTSSGLKHYEPSRRQCYFQKERYLRYFQIYTQSNCELECLANFTISQCGCVKFSMPRHASVPVCGAANIDCCNKAEDELLLKEFKQSLKTSGENYRGETECFCLPACTSIAYEAEISQADFEYKTVMTLFEDNDTIFTSDSGHNKMARISIFFKEVQFLTSKRSELYGTTDFLANCGGLLGLFMGVSTLSLVEILYFCTVRLGTNLKMRHEKQKEFAKNSEKEDGADRKCEIEGN